MEMVPWALGAGFGATFFGDEPPNRLKVPLGVAFLGAGAFFSATVALGAGFLLVPPNRLKVPLGVAFLGAGAFASTAAFALGLLVPKRLNVGDFDAGLTTAFFTAGDAGFFVCAAPFWTGVF